MEKSTGETLIVNMQLGDRMHLPSPMVVASVLNLIVLLI